jgi:hypothetical protein
VDLEGKAQRAITASFTTLALAQSFHLGNARSRARAVAAEAANRMPGRHALVVILQVLAVHLPSLASSSDAAPRIG